MQREKKYLGQATLNADDADFALAANDVVNMSGFRTGSTDNGEIGSAESVGGMKLIPNEGLPITGLNTSIGNADDLSDRREILFNWNSEGQHGIYCYDYLTGNVYTVLLSKDVVGGLNFSQYKRIDARVLNGCVYWTDDLNEYGRADINAGINLYQPGTIPGVLPYIAPLNFPVVRLIRRQPGLQPTSVRNTDLTFVNNFVQYEAYQFAVRYRYRNFEYSKLGPLSQTSNYNRDEDTFNSIVVTLPAEEKIDQDVIEIDLVALSFNTATYTIIKTWTTQDDAAAIAAHNTGTALTFTHYNDFQGIVIDFNEATTPFDSVPITGKALEGAKNRLYLGNFTDGYDTPSGGFSLALTPKQGSSAANQVTGLWIEMKIQHNCQGVISNETLQLLDVSDIPDSSRPGYYVYVPGVVPPAYPTTVDFAQLSFRGTGPTDVRDYSSPGCINQITEFKQIGITAVVTNAPSPPFVIGQRAMKSDASYFATIDYKDYAGRKSGVINKPVKIYIPDRNYQQVNYVQGIDWALSNANALTQIPNWAYYYSVNLTKCERTRYFVQLRGANATYASKDPKDPKGALLFTTAAFDNTLEGCAFDVSNLFSFQMGYVYTPGDIIKVYILGAGSYQLGLTGQFGNWVTTELKNIGTLDNNTKFLFEIYTPYRPLKTEPYYEQGQQYSIVNPGTAQRAYSVTNGTFRGDITLLNRNNGTENYLVEAMSPNDKLYKNWNDDAGRANFVDNIGQTRKSQRVAYSETFVNGGKANGLSTFKPLNTRDVPSELGDIMKLILASKVQAEGTIMLAICNGGETASLYLSERTLNSVVGDAVIMGTDEVIGTINVLKGSRGTLNPESVVEYKGNVRWIDTQNGAAVQYSLNGLFDVSDLKMSRFWGLYSQQMRSMTPQQIEILGDRPFIISGVDTYHDEWLVSIPKTLQDPPKGYLPDDPTAIYPFDIWDGRGKTLVYNVPETRNKWQGSLPFVAESMFSIENLFYSVRNGELYQHNISETPGLFYGQQFNAKIMAVSNQAPNQPKVYNNVSVEANTKPVYSYLYTKYPNIQATDLVPVSWTTKEGIFYSLVMRDKLDPKFYPDMEAAILRGGRLRGTALYVMYEFDVSGGIVNVKFINFGYTPSLGHAVQI